MSDSRTSSGHGSPLIAVQWLHQQPAHPHLAHFAKGDFRLASLHQAQAATRLHALHCSEDFGPFKHSHKSMDRTNRAAQRPRFEVFGQNALGLLDGFNHHISISLHQ
jgi:hypothetical protein